MLFSYSQIYSQISVTKVTEKNTETSPAKIKYDTTQNFLADNVDLYKGQILYLNNLGSAMKDVGYKGFSPGNNINEVYKCCSKISKFNSICDSLAGKYFRILNIHPHPQSKDNPDLYGHVFYFQMIENKSKDTVFYEYFSNQESLFPFIRVPFFENQKKRHIGKKFVFSNSCLKDQTDINSGQNVSIVTGQEWKCVDFTIEDKEFYLSLVLQNIKGQKIILHYDDLYGHAEYQELVSSGRIFTLEEANKYRLRFGINNFNLILNRKIVIGMNKEMCKMSWGEPSKINQTITGRSVSEQWVYSDNYLYFTNGVLTAMQ